MIAIRHLDVFSGIGGFSLAVDAVWPNAEHIFCDNDPFCQQVLKKHWPNSKIYGDIRELTYQKYIDDCNSCEYNTEVCITNVKNVEQREQSTEDSLGVQSVLKNRSISSIGRIQRSHGELLMHIGKQICNDIENLLKREGVKSAKRFLMSMGANAFVVEKITQHFFRLTTKTTMDSKIGENMEPDICMNLLKDEDFRQLIKYFVTTVITPKQYTKYALTENDIRTLTANPKSRKSGKPAEQERRQNSSRGNSKVTAHAESPRQNGGFIKRLSELGEIYILTGGFPCQPFSQAGQRKGTDDNRFLWPEMHRVIREFKPKWVIGENVAGLLTIEQGLVFEQVCTDLEAENYEVQAFIIPAIAVNAPHRRDRIWIVAHRKGEGRQPSGNARGRGNGFADKNFNASDTGRKRRIEGADKGIRSESQEPKWENDGIGDWERDWPEVASELCGVDDGIPAKLDGFELSKPAHRRERLKALGNAIVPAVAVEIMKAIRHSESTYPQAGRG